jgi:hypothetical protein
LNTDNHLSSLEPKYNLLTAELVIVLYLYILKKWSKISSNVKKINPLLNRIIETKCNFEKNRAYT